MSRPCPTKHSDSNGDRPAALRKDEHKELGENATIALINPVGNYILMNKTEAYQYVKNNVHADTKLKLNKTQNQYRELEQTSGSGCGSRAANHQGFATVP
jgi:hypothetical protein